LDPFFSSAFLFLDLSDFEEEYSLPFKVTVFSPPVPAAAWNALSDSLNGASPVSCLAFIDAIEVSAITLLDRCSLDGQHGLENGRLPAADMRLRPKAQTVTPFSVEKQRKPT
jgi:hypothetical protein